MLLYVISLSLFLLLLLLPLTSGRILSLLYINIENFISNLILLATH